jgi:hypothetical protein
LAFSSTVTNFLKSKYVDGAIPKQVIDQFPTFARIPKRTDGGGDQLISSVLIGRPQGIGNTLAIAQAGAAQGSALQDLKGRKWIVQWGDYSASVYIDDKSIKASRNNETTFLNWLNDEIDQLQQQYMEHMSTLLFAEVGRYIGVGTISTGVITLATPADIIKFPLGAMLQASANDGSSSGHSLLGAGSIGYVIAQDEGAGTLTVASAAGSSTPATPASWASTMYFFRNGDFGGGGAPGTIYQGLGAWIPPTAPVGGDSFNAVDRSVAPAQLAGFRLLAADVAGLSTKQRLTKLLTLMNTRGTTPGVTDVILNPEKWQVLADEVQATGWRMLGEKAETEINYSTIRVAIGGKVLEIVSDRHCPYATAYALTMPAKGSNICLWSMDELPFIVREDGLEIFRSSNANTYEHRLQGYPALLVKAPGWCGRCPV